jgi:hypothetical protein
MIALPQARTETAASGRGGYGAALTSLCKPTGVDVLHRQRAPLLRDAALPVF